MGLIKICGLQRQEEIEIAFQEGADFVGLVLEASSPRFVGADAETLLQIAPARTVAVFGPAPEVAPVGFLVVQSFGQLDSPGIEHWEAVRGLEFPTSGAKTVVVDKHIEGEMGGTGVAWNTKEATNALKNLEGRRRFLAGGLTPENVADYIRWCQPEGVDVSSGVERERGTKDLGLIQDFIREAKTAFAELEKMRGL